MCLRPLVIAHDFLSRIAALPGRTAGAPTPELEDANSPACGHVAIKFDDKIAFARADGELDVFTTPDGSSVDELCFCPHDELVARQRSDCCEDPDCGSQMIIPERRECCDHSEAHVHSWNFDSRPGVNY